MKKLLLIASAALALSASAAELTKSWDATISSPLKDGASYSAPMAVDAKGNVIATGIYDQEITIGTTKLEYEFGTNAYLAKYDAAGAVKWAVAITGSVTPTAVETDADGNIYLAGVFADEIVFNTTSGEPMTGEGALIDGAPAQKQNAAFITKYDADGKLLYATYYVPEKLAALNESFGYYPEDGDVFFRINNLQVVGDKVYASASYTGQTRKSDGKYLFEGSSINLFGFMDSDSAASSVFSVNAEDLKDVTPIVRMGLVEPAIIEDMGQPMSKSANFIVEDGKLYAAFFAVGPVTLSTSAKTQKLEKDLAACTYTLVEIDTTNGAVNQMYTADFTNNGSTVGSNIIAGVYTKGDQLHALGYECISVPGATPEAEATNSYDIFVFSAPKASLASAEKNVKSIIDGTVTYYGITTSAQLADGTIVFDALGYYNATDGDKKNGEFAGLVKMQAFDGTAFADWTLVPDAVGIAAEGAYAAFSQVVESNVVVSLYTDNAAGVDDVLVADPNAPVEYYNLQGIRVAEPSTGVYIRRQGDKVSKVLVK